MASANAGGLGADGCAEGWQQKYNTVPANAGGLEGRTLNTVLRARKTLKFFTPSPYGFRYDLEAACMIA